MQIRDFHSDIFIRLKRGQKIGDFHYKKHKKQTSDFHSDIFIRLKSIKSKQATFTHKKHKMQISDFYSDIFIRLKKGATR